MLKKNYIFLEIRFLRLSPSLLMGETEAPPLNENTITVAERKFRQATQSLKDAMEYHKEKQAEAKAALDAATCCSRRGSGG